MNRSLWRMAIAMGIISFGVSAVAQADESMCGGTIQYTADCEGNTRAWHVNCCPSGYRVQGVAYTDVSNQDHVDAVSSVCRSIKNGNDLMPSDFSRTPKSYVCDKTEVMSGIYKKDVITNGGNRRDTLDGVTAICEHPKTGAKRTLFNQDLDNSTREGTASEISLPQRVVGIAYKELDKGESDRADCVAIIVK